MRVQPGIRFQGRHGQPLLRADHNIVEFFLVGCGGRSLECAISRVAHHEVLRHPRICAAHEKGDTATSNTGGVEVREIFIFLNLN